MEGGNGKKKSSSRYDDEPDLRHIRVSSLGPRDVYGRLLGRVEAGLGMSRVPLKPHIMLLNNKIHFK